MKQNQESNQQKQSNKTIVCSAGINRDRGAPIYFSEKKEMTGNLG